MSNRTIIVLTALATGFLFIAVGSVAPVGALSAVIGAIVAISAAFSLMNRPARPVPVRFDRRNLRM